MYSVLKLLIRIERPVCFCPSSGLNRVPGQTSVDTIDEQQK